MRLVLSDAEILSPVINGLPIERSIESCESARDGEIAAVDSSGELGIVGQNPRRRKTVARAKTFVKREKFRRSGRGETLDRQCRVMFWFRRQRSGIVPPRLRTTAAMR